MHALHALPLVALVALVALPASALDCIRANGATVATWCARGPTFSEARLTISEDDGVTWTDTGNEVEDACASARARVHAVANDESGALPLSYGPVAQRPIPLATALAIRSFRRTLYVLGEREGEQAEVVILASDDEGARWRELAVLPAFVFLEEFDVTANRRGAARLRVLSAEGLSCFGTVQERLYVIEDGRLTTSLLLDEFACANHGEACAELDILGLAAHGAAYALVRRGESDVRRIALVTPTERVAPTSLRTDRSAFVAVGHNGRITLAVVGEQLVRLDGTRARVLDRAVPSGIQTLHVDARGRAWVIRGDALLRFSRGHGFEVVRQFGAEHDSSLPPDSSPRAPARRDRRPSLVLAPRGARKRSPRCARIARPGSPHSPKTRLRRGGQRVHPRRAHGRRWRLRRRDAPGVRWLELQAAPRTIPGSDLPRPREQLGSSGRRLPEPLTKQATALEVTDDRHLADHTRINVRL